MNQRTIFILSVIFGALVLGLGVQALFRAYDRTTAGSGRDGSVLAVSFDPAKVEKILIGRPVQPAGRAAVAPVELVKDGAAWKVKNLWNAKADPAKIKTLLQKIGALRGEFRGSGKDLFPDFGITDTEAFSLKFEAASDVSVLDLRIGTKPAGNGYFVRKAGGNDVYFAEIDLAGLFGIFTPFEDAIPAGDFWADVTLFDLAPEKVRKITVNHIRGTEKQMTAGCALEKDPKDPAQTTWVFLQRADRSFALDPDKVLRFIATLNSVKAQKVVDPAGKDYGLEKPAWEIAVTEGERETVLSLGAKDEKTSSYFVKISAVPAIFQLSAYYAEDLQIDDSRFMKEAPKENPPVAAPAKL
ncbi:MAG TPA: DUF4340 domain-containing protein [Candidatus Omnitrophota bacterium]|mgnify:CR=1 FL=1|nr:DUF4340 domain-containing protein [Candidatus Omnitrophota bacterium]HPS36221.1 DUF4340 domain-containing protein [Candidatus Omnitrophota bacterium]